MKILSLFDGMSVAQQALKNAGIPVDAYYASEIDEYAMAVTQSNFPDTVQLGNVQNFNNGKGIFVKESKLLGPIELLIGGSPCQDLSIAKKDRKGLAGKRSGLFWEYVRIRDEVKPKYFILENVASMSQESKDTISKALGVQPVMINASLVSAQNRKRLFWVSSRLDLCYNCKYEQLLKEIQHRREKTKTQKGGIGLLLQEKSQTENKLQDLRQGLFSSGINSEMLLGRMYDCQQEKKRYQTNTTKERISEKILREKKERITGIWKDLSPEQQREFSEILQKIHFQTRSQNEKSTEGGLEEKQENYQYDWERGIVGYVEKNKQGVCFLRFFGGHNSRPYNPSEQGWNERFGELTTTLSELQFLQKGQVNYCSCCGGIIPVKYQQVEIPQPEDEGILLKDILENGDADRLKSYCIDASYFKGATWKQYKEKGRRQLVIDKNGKEKLKSNTVRTSGRGSGINDKHNWDTIRIGQIGKGGQAARIYSPEGKSVGLSALGGGGGAKTGLYHIPHGFKKEKITEENKYPTLHAQSPSSNHLLVDPIIRKLTPIECLRLQSMPDDYFDKALYKEKPISNTQRYKMCGNAFNCKVIEHILKTIWG